MIFCILVWSRHKQTNFFTFLGRSAARKTFPFFKKTKKIIKRKKCHVFCSVRINTEEAVLIMPETADDIEGRDLLITTEKKKKPCNENEEAKLEIIDNCDESDGDEAVIIENGNFETVSDFSVVDKNSSILKNKNIDIVGELQSSCSFSMTRNIGNSVDDVPIPDPFEIDCSKSYNAEDSVSNDKSEKETGRYCSGDENCDNNTYHSDDNENVSVVNETGPIGEICEDKRFNEKRKLKFTYLTELRIKSRIFSTSIYLQVITRILGQ